MESTTEGALRWVQLTESLECTETCETPDAMLHMEYATQDALGDEYNGTHAVWGPGQKKHVAQGCDGPLGFAGNQSFLVGESSLEAAHGQQLEQLPFDSAAAAAGQQQWQQQAWGPHGFCCTYMSSTQATTGITPTQRASVIDNMVEAAANLGLANDSLCLATQLLDRYLAVRPTELQLLQPTAIACLRIAGKYEGCTVPPAAYFSQLMLTPRPPQEAGDCCCCCEELSNNSGQEHADSAGCSCCRCVQQQLQQQAALQYESGCHKQAAQQQQQAAAAAGEPAGCSERAVQLLNKLELTVLQQLDYRVAFIPTVVVSKRSIMHALISLPDQAALHAQQYSQLLYCCVSFLCEAATLEYCLLALLPQQIAAAAFAVAHMLLGLPLDDALLARLTGYCTGELLEPMQVLVALHSSLWQALHCGRPYAVTRKYCSDDACGVGCGVPPIVSRHDARVTMVAHKIQPGGQQV